MSQRSLKPKKILFFVQAYNVLAAQIEQTKQLGQKLEAKILDVRDVDVSGEVCVNFVTLVTCLVVNMSVAERFMKMSILPRSKALIIVTLHYILRWQWPKSWSKDQS